MIILSNGYQLPETGDFGDEWFPALESNIQRLNSHSHDGVNSEKIPSSGITGVVQLVPASEFIADGSRFRAEVVLAGGSVNIDNKTIVVRDTSTKNVLYMDTAKVSSTTVYIYTPIARLVEVVVV